MADVGGVSQLWAMPPLGRWSWLMFDCGSLHLLSAPFQNWEEKEPVGRVARLVGLQKQFYNQP